MRRASSVAEMGDPGSPGDAILDVEALSVTIEAGERSFSPVRGVSFALPAAGKLALVGESGSGKSLTLRAILGLLPKHASAHGAVRYRGQNLLELSERQLTAVRGRQIAMIFQDPSAALNPIRRIGTQLAEVVRNSGVRPRADVALRIAELLRMAGLDETERVARSYPHQLSGGMRQRALIAIALAGDPAVMLCDEPTTALDVTVQEEILDTLRRRCDERGTALVFVTHDLAVARQMCDDVFVIYGGLEMERGPVEEVFADPRHVYTFSLLGSIPDVRGSRRALVSIPGEPSAGRSVPRGCPFHPRCPLAQPVCAESQPPPFEPSARHRARCIHAAAGFRRGAEREVLVR
jgi:peptide/nickel transport system ATP-binding protein